MGILESQKEIEIIDDLKNLKDKNNGSDKKGLMNSLDDSKLTF